MNERPYAIMAEFETPAAILRAAEKVRGKRLPQLGRFHARSRSTAWTGRWASRIPKWAGFPSSAACTGYATGMLMIWFMNTLDYPIVIGGKPMFSPFSAFPPSYELTILFGAFGALLGMLFLNRLPRLHHPLLKNARFALASHDRFFVVIETNDPKYSETATRKLLEALGSAHIELVEE